jgi:hypothetical protein
MPKKFGFFGEKTKASENQRLEQSATARRPSGRAKAAEPPPGD